MSITQHFDRILTLQAELKTLAMQMDTLKQALAACENEVLTGLAAMDVESMTYRSAHDPRPYIFRRSEKTVYNIADWDAFGAHVLSTGSLYLLQRRVSQSGVEEFLQLQHTIPAGVSPFTQTKLAVTLSRKA